MKFNELEIRITKPQKNLIIPLQNHENHEIHRNPRQNKENHENLNYYTPKSRKS